MAESRIGTMNRSEDEDEKEDDSKNGSWGLGNETGEPVARLPCAEFSIKSAVYGIGAGVELFPSESVA